MLLFNDLVPLEWLRECLLLIFIVSRRDLEYTRQSSGMAVITQQVGMANCFQCCSVNLKALHGGHMFLDSSSRDLCLLPENALQQ